MEITCHDRDSLTADAISITGFHLWPAIIGVVGKTSIGSYI